jgi:outer membrane protein OmpA-like peptidoglycan-associated protein
MSTECLHRVTGAQDGVQERSEPGAAHRLPAWLRAIGIVAVLVQPGCTMPSPTNPVDWWHDLEGGPIAETRPPPPNADAPYPNLASVPARPKANNQSLRGRVASRLLADRASAQYAAATAPLTAPQPAAPAPPATAAPADQSEALGAKLQAASAPPRPAPPPARQAAAAAPSAPITATAAGPMPPIPASAPPPPVIAGLGAPAITVPTPPPRPPPVVPPPPPVTAPGTAEAVPFTAGSAVLTPAARTALRQFAQRRGAAPIAVIGYGEAASSAPPDQSAALPLAWERAQAIAGALRAAGVPAGMLRLAAEATGRGGVATIAD